jgi:HlyD family secretion protein
MRRKTQHTFWMALPMAAAITLACAANVSAAGADGTRENLATGSGSVEPISDQVQVGSPIPGKIKYVRASEGAVVRKGQILAILEFDEAMAQCVAAEASLEKSLAALHDAKGDAAKKAAESAVAAARAAVEDARFDWENHFVRAPIAGVVRHQHANPGEQIGDGPVVTMADASVLRVRMDTLSGDASKVRVGQSAYVTAEAFPGKKFPGKVVAIAAVPKANVKGGQTLIELDPGTALPLGSRVDAFVVGK